MLILFYLAVGGLLLLRQDLAYSSGFGEALNQCEVGPARLGPARPGSARLGPARLGSARLGSARLGPARLGSARLGSARLGPARLGSARLGSARLGSARPGSARLGPARPGSARLGSRPPTCAAVLRGARKCGGVRERCAPWPCGAPRGYDSTRRSGTTRMAETPSRRAPWVACARGRSRARRVPLGRASFGAQDLGSCFVTVFEVAVRQGAVGDRSDYLIFPTNETDHPDYTSITPEKLACAPPASLPPSCAVAWLGRAGGRAWRRFDLFVCLLDCRRLVGFRSARTHTPAYTAYARAHTDMHAQAHLRTRAQKSW
jgi:hypothetical protein